MAAALRTNWKWLAGLALSVVVTFFSYPPYSLGWLMFVGLVPVFVAAELAPTWRQAAFRVWLYVFAGNAAICWWVAYSVREFASLPWVLSYPAVFLLSFAEQGSWPVLAALRHLVQRRLGVRPLLWTPLALMFLDVVWPKFFPNTMGNVFYRLPSLSQVADVTGVWGLTALIAMTNELGAMLVLRRWPKRELWKHGLATAVVLACAFTYGHLRLAQVRQWMSVPKDRLRVALVQPNVNGSAKVRAEQDRDRAREELLVHMAALTDRAIKLRPELVFWPETAYPDTYHGDTTRESSQVTERLDRYLLERKVPLLFGARDQRSDFRYNSLYYVEPDPSGVRLKNQVYHKSILLELAEHVPLSDQFPSLALLVRSHGGTAYMRGPGPSLLEGPRGLKLGAMICLEGLYPRYVRETVLLGADVLVNATNDAWFGPGMEPELHLYLTAFRSIETRRPLVRATNTGYSAVVDIDGTLRLKTSLFTEDVRADDVPVYEAIRTPFMMFGDWLIALAGIYAALPFLVFAHSRFRKLGE